MNLNEIINQIESQVDIVDLIRSYIPLRSSGRNFKAVCPFHSEKTPSFMVSPSKGIWHCFGCEKGGNLIAFVKEFEQVSFWEAIKIIAQKYRINIPQLKERIEFQDEIDTEKEDLYRVLEFASDYYKQNLANDKINKSSLLYIEKRGLTKDIINKFMLGFSTQDSDGLLKKANASGFSTNLLLKAGLVTGDDIKKYYRDMLINKLMFPIQNSVGRVAGFAGRVFDNSTPKYINSPETKVYHKGSLLYGFHLAKKEIKEKGFAILVEGYMDVIVCHQYGFTNTVAGMGTALTDNQVKLIKKWCDTVILLYDSDDAGIMAASRNGQILENAGLKVNVVNLSKGEDPDSFLRKYGAKELNKLIQESKEFFLYFLDYSTSKYDIKTVNGKASAVKEIIPIIQASNNEIKRRFYIQKLSECIDIPEVAIISEIKKLKKGQSFDTQEIKKSDEKSKFSLLQAEKILINLLLDNSNLIEQTKSFFDLNWTTNEYSKKILSFLFTVDSAKICDIMNLLENFLSEEEFRFLRELILGFEFDNNVDKVWRDCLCCIRNSFIVSKKDYLIKQIKEAKSLNNSDQETKLLIEYYKLGEELASPFLNF